MIIHDVRAQIAHLNASVPCNVTIGNMSKDSRAFCGRHERLVTKTSKKGGNEKGIKRRKRKKGKKEAIDSERRVDIDRTVDRLIHGQLALKTSSPTRNITFVCCSTAHQQYLGY